MALSTEALAVMNELPVPGETHVRPNLIASYARLVAASHLSSFPADDATATTQAWLTAGGGTDANPSVFDIGAGLTLSINTNGTIAILGTDPASTAITVPGATTRGGVRRLLTALGVAFTG
jgi:hypothetical protein